MSVYEKVLEFHTIYGQPVRDIPNIDVPEKQLRLDLILEEFIEELDDAMIALDHVEEADALGDTVYVCYGAGLTFGLDLRKFFSFDDFDYLELDRREMFARLRAAFEAEDVVAVGHWLAEIVTYCYETADIRDIPLEDVIDVIHASNLSKLDEDGNPLYNAAGKVTKGPNYFPPTPAIKELLGV